MNQHRIQEIIPYCPHTKHSFPQTTKFRERHKKSTIATRNPRYSDASYHQSQKRWS